MVLKLNSRTVLRSIDVTGMQAC